MQTSESLKAARRLLERGWTEPLSYHADGTIHVPNCGEAGSSYAVSDALCETSADQAEFIAALTLLEDVAIPGFGALNRAGEAFLAGTMSLEDLIATARAPGAGWTLQGWLQSPKRTRDQVLAAFDAAVLRAQRMEAA